MVDRGFGIELEDTYGHMVSKSDFDPNWWNQAEDVDFKLNDEPVTRSGSSRMNKRARAGVLKPTGSTTADADLQQLAWYFMGYLDNYVYTAGSGSVHTHEFYGGEGKELPSFRGIAVYDMLKKYIYGMLIDGLKLDVSNENMTVAADWIYKTEKAGIIGRSSESFTQPDELTNEEIFIMFYDIGIKLNNKAIEADDGFGGISTSLSFEGKNNHNVDASIGLGSRAPQKRALAGKRENAITLVTSLTEDTVESILNAQYGQVGALEPTSCKILQQPLEINITHCENQNISGKILFPKCTLRVDFNMSGVDVVEATLTLDTLGSGTVTLADGTTQVVTDMYVKIVNNQEKIEAVTIS